MYKTVTPNAHGWLCSMFAISMLLAGLVTANAATVSGHVALVSKADAAMAVVYLSGDIHAAPLQHAIVDQRNRMFAPHVSVVTVGTTVKFPNDDTVFHNVFAYFRAKKFDLGMYPRGASKQVTFDKEGVVALLCNIHPDMSAYIMVVDTPFYATASSKGQFEIKDVPPGTYTLHAWHESGQEFQQRLVVTASPANIPIVLQSK